MRIICAESSPVANSVKRFVETKTGEPCHLEQPGTPDSSTAARDALVVGRNSLTSALVEPNAFDGLGDDGYLVRFVSDSNLVICAGNTLRSSLYAVCDWLEDRHNTADRTQTPAFKGREKLINTMFAQDFAKSTSRLVSGVFTQSQRPDVQGSLLDEFVFSMLAMRVNKVTLTCFGWDPVDFETIGFPEFYGRDDMSTLRAAVDRYLDAMGTVMDHLHMFGLQVGVYHCGVPGMQDADTLLENFFEAHPDVEASVGRDDPSINWHTGFKMWGDPVKMRLCCPSHPTLWDLVKAYYRQFFRRLPVDHYVFLIGDCGGALNCGCQKCKSFPYADRVKKFISIVHSEMVAARPDCLLVHRNDDFINYYPGREVQMEQYVLDGLPQARVSAKWAQPMNFDYGCDWRVIYDHPLIGNMPDLRLTFWYGWVAPTYDVFPGQYLSIYKKQLEFAADSGVTGIACFHEGDGSSLYQPRDIFRTDGRLYPWHADIEGFIKAMWDPASFDVGKFQRQWFERHFPEAADDLCAAFGKCEQVLSTLGRWDIGDYCVGGVPPFSYFDRIWAGTGLTELANLFYIRTGTFQKQSQYPRDVSFFDATPLTARMCMHMTAAHHKRADDENLLAWVGYAKALHGIAEAYKLYHEAYFAKRTGRDSDALRLLKEARTSLNGCAGLEDYGQTNCRSPMRFCGYFEGEIEDQVRFMEQGVEDPYDPGKHWKACACLQGETRDRYIHD